MYFKVTTVIIRKLQELKNCTDAFTTIDQCVVDPHWFPCGSEFRIQLFILMRIRM
jgi:hypothetical protein